MSQASFSAPNSGSSSAPSSAPVGGASGHTAAGGAARGNAASLDGTVRAGTARDGTARDQGARNPMLESKTSLLARSPVSASIVAAARAAAPSVGIESEGELACAARPHGDIPLDRDQTSAMHMFFEGQTAINIARALGVSRATVFRWTKDPRFQAGYNELHQEMMLHARGRLLSLTDKAAGAIDRALAAGDGRLGLALLKSTGVLSPSVPGSADPAEVGAQAERQRKRQLYQMQLELKEMEDEREAVKAG